MTDTIWRYPFAPWQAWADEPAEPECWWHPSCKRKPQPGKDLCNFHEKKAGK